MVDVEYGKLNRPAKEELLVVVESREPTVSCDVVAIKAEPSAFDVMMELGAKEVEPVPPFAIVFVKEELVERQVPLIAKQPVEML